MTAYHPFRSEAARKEVLALYDIRVKKWSVDSQTRFVDTAYGQSFVQADMINKKVLEFLRER